MTSVPRSASDGLDAAWRAPAGDSPAAGLTVSRAEPVARYTSFRVGGPADYLARPANLAALREALAWANEAGLPVRVIGGGSNLLVSDRGVRGLVIVYHNEREPLTVDEEGDVAYVTAPAQLGLSRLGRYCCERGWAGLDWAVGLPGTVGGAVANNAGAHGTETIDHLESVTVLTRDGALTTHPRDWLQARYRYTVLRASDLAERAAGTVAVAARFKLHRADPAALLALADEHAAWRKEHQPRKPCAGSIFKNPPGAYAGALLEAAGLKGLRIGGAEFSPVHANFIVNVGGATGADVLALIRRAQAVVRERWGIELETEVEFVGDWTLSETEPGAAPVVG